MNLSRLHLKLNPVRYLYLAAAAAALVERYVHAPLALGLLGAVVAAGEYARSLVLPTTKIETLTPAEWLDIAMSEQKAPDSPAALESAPPAPADPQAEGPESGAA